jgi:formylglycine-generating enzyme required for sulfatase activity
MGSNPSFYGERAVVVEHNGPGAISVTLAHPVTDVSWLDCAENLRRLGLVLPTEAQWEYGARSGTSSRWWTGSDPKSLKGAANLEDPSCERFLGGGMFPEEWLDDDGFPFHAPVGSFRPNLFGLFDTVGNVGEWCQDLSVSYKNQPLDGNGLRVATVRDRPTRVVRGGALRFSASRSTSAFRMSYPPEQRMGTTGVRPARDLR